MIVLACILGLRISDIKNLTFDNFNWEEKKLSIIQHKTKKGSLIFVGVLGTAPLNLWGSHKGSHFFKYFCVIKNLSLYH